MRKLYYFISAAVIALGMASCSKVESSLTTELPTDRQITIIANTESSVDTKTYLSGDDATGYQVLWSEGDKIFLRNRGYNREFTLKDGAGTTRGTFVSYEYENLTEGQTYDIYYAMPGSELYGTSSYEPGNVISSIPMKGKVTYQDGVATVTELKNLCGLLRLSLTGSGTVKDIKVSADQLMAGECSISADYAIRVFYGQNYVIQNCGDGVELSAEAKDFYISLPPNNYSGVTIEIKDFYGNTSTKTLKEGKTMNIARAQITPVSLTVSGLEHNTPGSLAGVFTVNDEGKKVRFSKGNLYWDGDSFEFEDNQCDCPDSRNSSHVGHFYWLEDAGYACAKDYYLDVDLKSAMIFTNDFFLNREKPNGRFEVNGVKGRYRTLSMLEWDYIMLHNNTKWATVNGMNGCLIAPDGVTLEAGKVNYSNEELLINDLVFLPAAGHSDTNTVSFFNTYCNYWSTTVDMGDSKPFFMSYDGVNGYQYGVLSHQGCPLRLVLDMEK